MRPARISPAAIKSSQVAIAVTDVEGRPRCVNRAFLRLWRFDCEEDVLGHDPKLFWANPNRLEEVLHQLRSFGGWTGHLTARRRDGSEFEVHLAATAATDRAGRVVSMIGSFSDISDQKSSQQKTQLLAALVEMSLAGVAVLNPEGTIVYLNPEWARLHDFCREEMLAKHISTCHLAGQISAVEDALEQTRRHGRFQGELWHARRDGGPFPTLTHLLLVPESAEAAQHIIATCVDISQQKEAEQTLLRATELRAEAEKLAARGSMAAHVAHEINNPLAGIVNCFQLVKQAIPEDHEYYQYARMIEEEIERIRRIVRQLYEHWRPQKEEIQEVDVENAVEEVVTMLGPVRREHEVAVEIHADSSAEPGQYGRRKACVPAGALRQVIYNVVANAIEASPKHAVVKIHIVYAENPIRIDVVDQGPGIPGELIERIFEPFFTTKRPQANQGLGLGLAISKRIIESAGGSLRLDRNTSSGARFSIGVPEKQ